MSRSTHIARFAIALLPLLAGVAPSSTFATPFVTEVVNTPGYLIGTSMTLDAYDVPHIAGVDSFSGLLYYITRRGGVWVSEVADSFTAGGYYNYTSIAVDAERRPHIAFYADGPNTLQYATRSEGSWTVETIDDEGDVGSYNSIAVDGQGVPHVSYYSETADELRYAARLGGAWGWEPVDDADEVGYWTSIQVDPSGRPHISYWDEHLKNLKYAEQSYSFTWVLQSPDTTGNVGEFTSLELDWEGNPIISYYDHTNTNLKIARRSSGTWTFESPDTAGNVGTYTNLSLDPFGNLHVAYVKGFELRYARKTGTSWTTEVADALGRVSPFGPPTMALDAQGNPVMAYFDDFQDVIMLTSASIRVDEPLGGDEWMIGSIQNVSWTGLGPVEIALSTDGGATFTTLVAQANESPYALRVPRSVTNHARIRLTRTSPLRIAFSDSSFTIDSTVALSVFYGGGSEQGGVLLAWQTDPGPEDLAGYRIERAAPGGPWQVVTRLTRGTTLHDPAGQTADRYRLIAINNFGGEQLLGEWSGAPGITSTTLAAWPMPYRGGTMHVSFATHGGLGGGTGDAEVGLYDVHGRLVRSVARGAYAAGSHVVTWDGRDAAGRDVGAGIYFLRAVSAGQSKLLKVAVVR